MIKRKTWYIQVIYQEEEKPTKYGSPQKAPNSIQTGIARVLQKKISDQRLLLNWGKLIFTPSKALLFRSFQMTHVKARGVTSQALCLLPLATLFQLSINSLIVLGTTQETPNHLKISSKVFKTPKNIYNRGGLHAHQLISQDISPPTSNNSVATIVQVTLSTKAKDRWKKIT